VHARRNAACSSMSWKTVPNILSFRTVVQQDLKCKLVLSFVDVFYCTLQPFESWVRMVHRIRLMATTYAALRKWAAAAGLSAEQSMLDRYITPIAGLTAARQLTFRLKDFRIAKEVCDCDNVMCLN